MPYAPKVLSRNKHLVLVHHPGWQDVSDFYAIKDRIEKIAPDISVFITNNREKDKHLERTASLNPTLVVCPSWLGSFAPGRGKIYKGKRCPKDEQLARMGKLGLPVPRWALANPGLKPGPDEWGKYVIIKPAHSFSGLGLNISIVATENYKYRAPEDYPEFHVGREAPMLVQSFIKPGDVAKHYRVNTLFGQPLYCMQSLRTVPLPELTPDLHETFSDTLATNLRGASSKELKLVNDEDVLNLASQCHRVYPEVPLKGVDIIREEESGRLYVLELNCTSNTWHISSKFSERIRVGKVSKERMINQFGAWDVAAKLLVKHTRLEAI